MNRACIYANVKAAIKTANAMVTELGNVAVKTEFF